MSAVIENDVIQSKIIELCQTILDQPEFADFHDAISSFSKDEEAQDLLTELSDLSMELRQMQSMGNQIPEAKITAYDLLREKAHAHPICKPFMDTQAVVHNVQQTALQHIAKTYELGHMPQPEDFSCGCGTGCGCH